MYEIKTVLVNNVDCSLAYICLHDIKNDLYSVQQCEFLYKNEISEGLKRIGTNSLELFLDDPQMERHTWFKTLNGAIEFHEQSFGNRMEIK